MEKQKEEIKILQIDPILLAETLKQSPFFKSLSKDDVDQIMEKVLHPDDVKPISTRRPNISF